MLLTVFKTKNNNFVVSNTSEKVHLERISEKGYLIDLGNDEKNISGILLEGALSTFLVWKTYNIETALKLTCLLEQKLDIDSTFKQYSFKHDLFVNWLEHSTQVMECSFDTKSGERRLTSFNLKNSKQFLQMLGNINIKFMVFTLEPETVIVTAREEGRFSITPDIDHTKLVNVLDKLFGNNIMVANV